MRGANVVVERPRWARRDLALALTGIGAPALLRLVNEGIVRARKTGEKRGNSCVFCVPDVEEWLEKEALPAGPFVIPGEKPGEEGKE